MTTKTKTNKPTNKTKNNINNNKSLSIAPSSQNLTAKERKLLALNALAISNLDGSPATQVIFVVVVVVGGGGGSGDAVTVLLLLLLLLFLFFCLSFDFGFGLLFLFSSLLFFVCCFYCNYLSFNIIIISTTIIV